MPTDLPGTSPLTQKPPKKPPKGQPSDAGTHTVTVTTTTAPTWIEVPVEPEAPKPGPITGALGGVTASESSLGELEMAGIEGGTEPASPVGELSFENPGLPDDPMADLHMPQFKKVKIPGKTETHTEEVPNDPNGGGVEGVSGWRRQVVNTARKLLGTPYVWGGTNYSGVDCSGLVLLAFKAASMSMPRISADQARKGRRVSLSKLRPGDLVAWDNSSRNNGADHIAIYIGNGMIIEAPRPGRNVQISHIYDKGNAWGVSLG